MTCGGVPQSIQGISARRKNMAYSQPQILSMIFACGYRSITDYDMRTETAGHGKKVAWVSLCEMTALIAATARRGQWISKLERFMRWNYEN